MQPDPTLIRLAEEAARAARALQDYIAGAHVEPEDDLVSLKDAEVEFRISNDTARRWAKLKGLGIERDGRLYLRRSLVRHHGLA